MPLTSPTEAGVPSDGSLVPDEMKVLLGRRVWKLGRERMIFDMIDAQKAPGKSSSRYHSAVGEPTSYRNVRKSDEHGESIGGRVAYSNTTDWIAWWRVVRELGVPHSPYRVDSVGIPACSSEDLSEMISLHWNREASSRMTDSLVTPVPDVCRSPNWSARLSESNTRCQT